MTYVHNGRLRRIQEQGPPRRKGTTSTEERKDALKVKVTLPSVAIQRIVDEVRRDDDRPTGGYNRTYHRHNR